MTGVLPCLISPVESERSTAAGRLVLMLPVQVAVAPGRVRTRRRARWLPSTTRPTPAVMTSRFTTP